MKVNTIVSTLTATLLLSVAALHAEPGNFGVNGANAWSSVEQKRIQHTDAFGDTYYTYSAEKPKKFVEHEVHQHKQQVNVSPQEVVNAYKKALRAVILLHENNTTAAIKTLQQVTTQLQTALKKEPTLHQVLVSQEITVAQYVADSAQIQQSISLAERLLKEHSVQSAREIVLRLQDALIVDNASIVVPHFADNVQKALVILEKGALLEKDERDAALLLLNMALNDVVYERVIVPIPLLKAQHFVVEASTLDVSKKDTLNAYLDGAQEELKRAVLLGYIKENSSEYKTLKGEIETIQKTLKGNKAKSPTLYDRIKRTFEKLLNETRHKIIQSSAEANVNRYERHEDSEAFQKRKVFSNEAVDDAHKTLKTTP